jgi:EAL domain-containing protein (putative c-di-GMP-specific phosphodiesterase class I)
MGDPKLRVENETGCRGSSGRALTMAFQPIVDIEARRIFAYEALVRGPNGESAGSVLSAVSFADHYDFDQVCRVTAIETAVKLGLDCRLHINIMPTRVDDPEASLKRTLATAKALSFPVDLITFEFTEDERVADRAHLPGIAEVYRRHGLQIALDDFGAGYAGLSLLADFQPDILKIDRVLVSHVDSDRPRQLIISGLLAIARDMGLQVVAEGVERKEELAFLRRMGIRYVQGFFFAVPTIGHLVRDDEIVWG